MSGKFVYGSYLDGETVSSMDHSGDEFDDGYGSPPKQPTFLGLSYIWWIVITVVIIILIGFLIWWFAIRSGSQTNQNIANSRTNTTGSNSGSSTITGGTTTSGSTSTVNGNNTSGNSNPPVSNNPSTGTTPASSDPSSSSNGPVTGPPTNLIDLFKKSLGYPDLGPNPIYFDPFIPYKNMWVAKELINEVQYPFNFHLARLFTIISGIKYYLQFNDPYSPDAWPNPSGELFNWISSPNYADVYTSIYSRSPFSDNEKIYRLNVHQHPYQGEPKPGARLIYGGYLKDNDTFRLSTTDSNGVVYLTTVNQLLYLVARVGTFDKEGKVLDYQVYNYYIDKGVGRFCSEAKAKELKLRPFTDFPLGVEQGPIDMNRFAEQIGKP